jgi:hypothetical protein
MKMSDTEMDLKREQTEFMDWALAEKEGGKLRVVSAFKGWLGGKRRAAEEYARLQQVHRESLADHQRVVAERDRLKGQLDDVQLQLHDGRAFRQMAVVLGEGGAYPDIAVKLLRALNEMSESDFADRPNMESALRQVTVDMRRLVAKEFGIERGLAVEDRLP